MSLLRALRRCKTSYDFNASLDLGILRCFEVPSRRSAVEPFAVMHEDTEGEDDDRLFRAAPPPPHPTLTIPPRFEPCSTGYAGCNPYQNLWAPTPTSQPAPMQIDSSQQTTATGNRTRILMHNRPIPLHDLLDKEPQTRDWNAEFQAILKRPLLERGTELAKLCDEFVSTAKNLGEVILREHNLPPELKSIKPIPGKGKAGGEKFKVSNIFFKFAVDQEGLYASDAAAMKVAGHELKGLTALVSCGMMLGLNFPLLALIDYRGFRLIATSVLPISEETIVYGSCDGGVTVHTDLPEMNFLMEKISKILNLKGHWTGIGNQLKWLHSPCDIEGHGAKDGKLYIVDTARVWPCETPDPTIKGGFLYRMLRPELVKNNPTPLSSDAFTYFGHHDAEIHNAEVAEATLHLFEDVIPDFAASLEGRTLSPEDLVEELHRAGINCRHLGMVRQNVISPTMKEVILLEIVARVVKNILRAEMRQSSDSEETAYNRLAVSVFNVVFGCVGENTVTEIFWRKQLRSDLLGHFTGALDPHEQAADYDISRHINMAELFKRVQVLSGVVFRKGTDPTRGEPFTTHDLIGIRVRTKHMYAVPRIQADTLAEVAHTKEPVEAMRLYAAARELYKSVIALKPDDATALLNLGIVLADQAKLKPRIATFQPLASPTSLNAFSLFTEHVASSPPNSNHTPQAISRESDRLFELACEKFECASSLRPFDHRALVQWANALSEQADLKDGPEASALYAAAADKYKLAHELRPSDRDILFNWGNLLRNHAKHLVARNLLQQGEKLLLNALGRYRKVMSIPSTKRSPEQNTTHSSLPDTDQQLSLDTLINCGCGFLALAKVRHTLRPQVPLAEEVRTCFEQARLQFLRAVAVVKRGGLETQQPERAAKYLELLAINMKALAAVESQCANPPAEGHQHATSIGDSAAIHFTEWDEQDDSS